MSIPLDRLYQFIENIAQEIYNDPIVIYRFYPNGSKKIEDLSAIHSEFSIATKFSSPAMYLYDQEPLMFDFYASQNISNTYIDRLIKYQIPTRSYNIDGVYSPSSMYDKSILLHSEQRSNNLKKYTENNFIPVYYWSHAIIALDWFRFAKYIEQKKQVEKTFLIYNRAWSGTREYRLAFVDLLIDAGLENHCQTTVNPIEPELNIHYTQHQFDNSAWKPSHILENYFSINDTHSHYSAVFNLEDYEATDIEVVLETLLDDDRLHLTEKSLRPIACGQPFILASTSGSLEYLRGYGFKTFNTVWDESYDQIADPKERLICIANLMQQIANWDPKIKESKISQARAIADHNRQLFFSQEFFNSIINELKTNLKLGFTQLENTNTSRQWLFERTELLKIQEYKKNRVFDDITRNELAGVLRKARQYRRV